MKLHWALPMALATILLTGCETLNYSQYQVMGTVNQLGVRAAVSPADRDAVKQIASAVAAQFKLVDMTSSSLVPNVVAYYTENDVANPMEIKVYTTGAKLIVDVMQSSAGGETVAFSQLKDTLIRELALKFGDRVGITPASEMLGAKSKKKVQQPSAGKP